MTIAKKIATNNSKVDTANKTARLAELKAEYDNLTDALLNDENISDERDANLRHLRADVRSEISKLEVASEAENNTKAAMTIEMKIAKNGVKMYYVRDNETGKLRRISADEARHAEYMNGVYKATEEKKATISNVAEHTPVTVEEKAEVIIPIVDYRTLLTWAEKVSNGQHDTAIQIVTHIKKWFNAETDKKTVIEVIKAGDLNGFRNFLCQFNFVVKDDGGCIHKLYRYDNGECVLAEIPTSEYAKYSTEEAAENSAATAETVIRCQVKSNNSIVVKINGKRVGRFDAQDAICGHDYQTNPVKIITELGEVFIGGIDRENNVYVFEWQGCGQVFEMPLSNDPIRLIAWRNLADYRETPASVKPAPKPSSPSTDDFAAKLAAIKAKQADAKAKLDEKTAAREQAQKAVEDALDAEDMAYIEWRAADDEVKRLLNGKAKELTDALWELPFAKIQIKSTIGKEFTCTCDWVVSTMNNNYQICDGWDFCGEYDTPEQVIDVITALSDAIKRGDTKFTFPTVNQLAEPATAEELDKQFALYRASGKAFYALNLALRGVPFGAERKQAKKALDDAFNRFNEKARAFEDSATEIYGKLEEQVQRATEERLHKVSAQVKAMVDAAIDRAQIETTTIDDDRDVFSLLPKLEGLNDHTETDPWLADDPAEYTDRDDRYNRGEKIAADLTAKLRRFDPTVEVTFDINEDDTDVFYLEYDGIYRTPFTVDGVEPSFHAMKQYHAEKDKTQIEDSLTRAMNIALEHYKGFCHIGNLTKAEHELKLYEICRKATRELWEE